MTVQALRVAPLPAGHRLGAWTIGEPVGQGGFGTTYCARDADGRALAVKELLPVDIEKE